MAGTRSSRRPGGAARAQPGFLRRRQCRHRRLPGAGVIQLLNNDTEVAAAGSRRVWHRSPIRRSGSVAPLVLVRSDPARVDSAGDSYTLWLAGQSSAATASPGGALCRRPVEEVFGASGSVRFLPGSRPCAAPAASILFSGSYYEDIDLASACAGPGIAVCLLLRVAWYHHDVSSTYDHGSPALQRRMSRNAEIVFWANLSAAGLTLSILPHLAFLVVQGAWRLARGRLRPFLKGKCDAIRGWREITARRRFRAELFRSALAPPHFALHRLMARFRATT